MADYQVRSNVMLGDSKIRIDDLSETEQISVLTDISLAAGKRYAKAIGVEIIGEAIVKIKDIENF